MRVHRWFSTAVYESTLQRDGGSAFVESMAAACRAVRDMDECGRAWCREHHPAGYTSYGTQRNLNCRVAAFAELEAKLQPHLRLFADRLDMDLREACLSMTDCWVNVMTRGATHPWHVHPGAVFSGTFYVATPPGCAPLSFEDPRMTSFVNSPPKRSDARPVNRARIAYEAQAGSVILFQSWLRHEVPLNESDEERISVSFNYSWL